MRIILISICTLFALISFSQDDYLVRIENEREDWDCGYVNSQGEMIVPMGKYDACFNDTIWYFGAVYDSERKAFIGINTKDEFLFEIFPFDNGPDYIVEGLFRIQEDGLIGFANEKGEVVIPPKYQAANYFEEGKAKVSYKANKTQHGEHWHWDAEEWFYIDKEGNTVE